MGLGRVLYVCICVYVCIYVIYLTVCILISKS